MFTAKYRPKNHLQVIGKEQRAATRFLTERVIEGNPPNAVLFTGNSGVGKTSVANLYAEALLCTNLQMDETLMAIPCVECDGCTMRNVNIMSINCASSTGIDNMRNLLETINFMGFGGYYKVYILDEVHALSKQAQNALLIPLENLPPHVVFCLATTEPNNIIKTLRSRCMEFDFPIPSNKEQYKLIMSIYKNNDREVDDESANMIIDVAGGNIRRLVHITEQYLSGVGINAVNEEDVDKSNLMFEMVYRGIRAKEAMTELEKIDDYDAYARMMVFFAAKQLRGGKLSADQTLRCLKIISVLGDGLSRDNMPKLSFMKRVADILLGV